MNIQDITNLFNLSGGKYYTINAAKYATAKTALVAYATVSISTIDQSTIDQSTKW
jgi:hypothetical protein